MRIGDPRPRDSNKDQSVRDLQLVVGRLVFPCSLMSNNLVISLHYVLFLTRPRFGLYTAQLVGERLAESRGEVKQVISLESLHIHKE